MCPRVVFCSKLKSYALDYQPKRSGRFRTMKAATRTVNTTFSPAVVVIFFQFLFRNRLLPHQSEINIPVSTITASSSGTILLLSGRVSISTLSITALDPAVNNKTGVLQYSFESPSYLDRDRPSISIRPRERMLIRGTRTARSHVLFEECHLETGSSSGSDS